MSSKQLSQHTNPSSIVSQILDQANISNTFIYSNLDPSARKINAAKFQSGKARVLIVTDVAARGIDIPHLDNVINFNFPAKCKLFVHRVGGLRHLGVLSYSRYLDRLLTDCNNLFAGRCARAGRTGTAYNIVAPDEYAYLLDLHLFLGTPFTMVPSLGTDTAPKGSIGKMPQSMVEQELAELICWHDNNTDLVSGSFTSPPFTSPAKICTRKNKTTRIKLKPYRT